MSVLEQSELEPFVGAKPDADVTAKSSHKDQDLAKEIKFNSGWMQSSDPRTDPLTLLLIHGFWTDEKQAVDNYTQLKTGLRAIDDALDDNTFTFSWPSSGRIFRDREKFFSDRDKVARVTGEVLAKGLLEQMGMSWLKRRHYVLVAHSLGSRVVMETLRHIVAHAPHEAKRFHIILMAAALPIEDFAPGADTGYAEILSQIGKSEILYSQYDSVLEKVFRPGLLWTTEQAVGLHGRPAAPWSTRARFAPYDHDHYWKDVDKRVSKHIAKSLNFEVVETLAQSPSDTGAPLAQGV